MARAPLPHLYRPGHQICKSGAVQFPNGEGRPLPTPVRPVDTIHRPPWRRPLLSISIRAVDCAN